MLILIVAGGPDKGRIYELTEEQPVVLGREGEGIKLDDRKCSRKHARLWAEGGKWYVRDLGSRHGTFVNAKPIDNKAELTDGDHLQLGQTLFVLARVPAEQAERLALLGDANGHHAATPPLPHSLATGSRNRLAYAGASLAAAVLIGSNALLYVSSQSHTDALRAEIAAAKAVAQQGSRDVIEEVQARSTAAELDPTLKQILAAVEAQNQNARLLGQIKDAIAKLPDAAKLAEQVAAKLPKSDDSRALIEQVLAKLDAQPVEQAKLLSETLAKLEAQPQNNELLQSILAKLDAQPDESEALKAILARLDAQKPVNPELLQSLAAKIDQRPQTDALLAEVKAMAEAARKQQEALAAKTQETDALLRQTLTQVKALPGADAFTQALRDAVEDSQTGNAKLLEQVLANLEEQAALAKQIAEVRQLVEAQPAATRAAVREIVASLPAAAAANDEADTDYEARVLEAIADLRAALPGDASAKLDQVLAKLDAQTTPEQFAGAVKTVLDANAGLTAAKLDSLAAKLDAQPTKQDLLAAIDKATADEPNPALLAKLDDLAGRLKAAAAPDDAIAARQAATAKLVEEVLAEVRNRQPIEALREELTKLAAAQPTSDPKLDQVLEAVQGSADLGDRIAELHDLMKAWPGETEAMLQETLAAVQASMQQPQDPAVDEMLRDLKNRAMARWDEFDAALRHDLRRELGGEQTAAAAPPAPLLSPRDSARRSAPQFAPNQPSRATLMAPRATGEDQLVQADEPTLTATEQAYKVAFETGQPVTIGAGLINPQTGAVSEGRTLVPSAARAAGIKHWREWYLMDNFAEQMRIKRQQMRFQEDRRDQNQGDYIALPPVANNATVNAMPEPSPDAAAADAAPTKDDKAATKD